MSDDSAQERTDAKEQGEEQGGDQELEGAVPAEAMEADLSLAGFTDRVHQQLDADGKGVDSVPLIGKGELEGMVVESWPRYSKSRLTPMLRIEGPFAVESSEGTLVCEDGYLAVDSHGSPYPISAAEQESIYDFEHAGEGDEDERQAELSELAPANLEHIGRGTPESFAAGMLEAGLVALRDCEPSRQNSLAITNCEVVVMRAVRDLLEKYAGLDDEEPRLPPGTLQVVQGDDGEELPE